MCDAYHDNYNISRSELNENECSLEIGKLFYFSVQLLPTNRKSIRRDRGCTN